MFHKAEIRELERLAGIRPASLVIHADDAAMARLWEAETVKGGLVNRKGQAVLAGRDTFRHRFQDDGYANYYEEV